MTFKKFTLVLLAFLGLTSCNQNSRKQTDERTNLTLLTDKEIFSLYNKTDSVIYIAKAMSNGSDKFDFYSYELKISSPEGAKQTFISVKQLTKEELNNKKNELHSQYNWIPFKGDQVLFVQIQPTAFKDEMQLLDKRQEIEDKLSKVLENRKLGEWCAGDLGPGGGNMLFTVTDLDKSLQAVLEVLQQNKLDKNVLIGKRILVAKGDWFYEVIYPIKYSGNFNTM
jgi:hypothetical protein